MSAVSRSSVLDWWFVGLVVLRGMVSLNELIKR